MADILRSYPPSLNPTALSYLVTSLTDYCLSHGITVRPSTPLEADHLSCHAPVTLFPSLFPRKAWDQALKVQTLYNVLYARIANDVDWLGEIMDEYGCFCCRKLILDLLMLMISSGIYGNCTKMLKRRGLFRYLFSWWVCVDFRIYL
jgi:hypothetical protein